MNPLEAALAQPAGVRSLSLERKGIRRLPPEIGLLSELESLSLEGNLLTDLPREILALPLKTLNLRRNRFVRLPPFLAKMATLNRLDLGVNQLREIAPLDGLTGLTSLELGPNPPLRRPPDWLWRMTWLTRLSLFRIPLGMIPHELSRLDGLTDLEMGEPGDLLEHERVIPTAVFSLEKLSILTVFGSSITVLPPEIARLKELRELSLLETRLTTLPPAIGELEALEKLVLDDNRITSLPREALSRLPRLRELSLGGNPLPAGEIDRLREALPSCRIEP